MTALMESRSGALELPSSAVASLAALVMRCIRAPAFPRLARSPPNIRCRTPSTADIAAAHRYAWPADWPSPFWLVGGASLCVPTGLVCMRPPLGVGRLPSPPRMRTLGSTPFSAPLPFGGLTRAGRHGISLVPREKHRLNVFCLLRH